MRFLTGDKKEEEWFRLVKNRNRKEREGPYSVKRKNTVEQRRGREKDNQESETEAKTG